MKNKGVYCLLLVLCVCLAFTGGLFVGRNANHSRIQVSYAATLAAADPTASPETGTTATEVPALVNINTATVAQLQTLPGIGEVLAQRIIDYREANGNFASVAELANVEGIGEKKLETILNFVTVGG